MNFSAVILAGGQSQRMGRDKAWLLLEGTSLLARQIHLVRKLGPTEIFISGRAGTDYGSLDCSVLHDRFEAAGPLAGIERALDTTAAPLLLVLAVDMPRMNFSQLQLLIAQCTEDCGRVSRVRNRIEPLASVYPRAALSLATGLLEEGRNAVTHFAERCVELKLAAFIDLPEEHASRFENWNTPADMSSEID
jgi:molybdopterin-guanine dinucleotide biosynthesis protein A